MEIILKQDVENLGFIDDIVTVKNGYGRNYLIPHGFAVLATVSAKKVLAETLKQRAYKEEKLIKDATKIADAIKELEIKIAAKTADSSKLFGSINNSDVAEALATAGYVVDKKFIKSFKSAGWKKNSAGPPTFNQVRSESFWFSVKLPRVLGKSITILKPIM